MEGSFKCRRVSKALLYISQTLHSNLVRPSGQNYTSRERLYPRKITFPISSHLQPSQFPFRVKVELGTSSTSLTSGTSSTYCYPLSQSLQLSNNLAPRHRVVRSIDPALHEDHCRHINSRDMRAHRSLHRVAATRVRPYRGPAGSEIANKLQ